jgi:hypothetical protein
MNNDTTNKHARIAIRDLLIVQEERVRSKLFGVILWDGMRKDRCRASGKLSDMY